MSTWVVNYTDGFYHHGIKGQRWGVRRFQKKDGSLTAAGKKRYDSDSSPPKQKKYDKYYQHYKDAGYSDEKAAETARGRIRTERTLKVVGAAAVTTAAAYVAYRYFDTNMDRNISAGKVMQTVHRDDISERLKPGSPFYATYSKVDHTIYASKVFTHFSEDSKVTKFSTKDAIKVASEKSGRKVFKELMETDPEIQAYAKEYLKTDKPSKKAYQHFNALLVLRKPEHEGVHQTFYEALRKKGYGGVIDVNDSKLEGFTFNPVILFDKQTKNIRSTTRATAEHLGADRLQKARKYVRLRERSLKPVDPKSPYVMIGGAYLASKGYQAATKYKRLDVINAYKKEHPNTKLTDQEILQAVKASK